MSKKDDIGLTELLREYISNRGKETGLSRENGELKRRIYESDELTRRNQDLVTQVLEGNDALTKIIEGQQRRETGYQTRIDELEGKLRGKGIEIDTFPHYTPWTSEPETEPDKYQKLIDLFENYFSSKGYDLTAGNEFNEQNSNWRFNYENKDIFKDIGKEIVLDPEEIYELSKIGDKKIKDPFLLGIYWGIFLSKLVQNSYNLGNNEFELESASNFLASYLRGSQKRQIKIKLKEPGIQVGHFSEFINVKVIGETAACGTNAKYSTFLIKGKSEFGLGDFSESCVFKIKGKIKRDFGYSSKNSTFYIGGKMRCDNSLEYAEGSSWHYWDGE